MRLRDTLTYGALHDILRGDCADWSRRDWYAALVQFPANDAKRIVARFLLDHTGAIGREIESEVLCRRAGARTKASGADAYRGQHDDDVGQGHHAATNLCHCGGEITPVARTGRTALYRGSVHAVPADFVILTCLRCDEEFYDEAACSRLDAVLEGAPVVRVA